MTPTIENPQKVDLEILKGHTFTLKNSSAPSLPSSLPNSHTDHLPNSKTPTLSHPSSPSH